MIFYLSVCIIEDIFHRRPDAGFLMSYDIFLFKFCCFHLRMLFFSFPQDGSFGKVFTSASYYNIYFLN